MFGQPQGNKKSSYVTHPTPVTNSRGLGHPSALKNYPTHSHAVTAV
jgi:hypothetical protein